MLKKILAAVLLLALVVYGIFQLPVFGGRFAGERLKRMQASKEFIDGRFENTPPENTSLSIRKTWGLYSQGQKREPDFIIPVMPLTPADLQKPASPGLRAYWFGHASVLLEIEGLRVMTDPILSEYASPFDVGPKRMHPPPIALDAITNIDAVVISHDHYDHLDMPTIQRLAGQGTQFYVPLGIGAHLERWGVPSAQIHDMEWWDKLELKGVTIHCTPARHYSGRKNRDNSTLWSSWVIKGAKRAAYFSGDTGYSPHFAAIHAALGDMDLTILKVGAYGETWLDIHMDPESSVKAHKDLGGKTMLPVHWGTFNLSYHAWEEPIVRTLTAAKEQDVNVITPKIGQPYDADQPFQNEVWYLTP